MVADSIQARHSMNEKIRCNLIKIIFCFFSSPLSLSLCLSLSLPLLIRPNSFRFFSFIIQHKTFFFLLIIDTENGNYFDFLNQPNEPIPISITFLSIFGKYAHNYMILCGKEFSGYLMLISLHFVSFFSFPIRKHFLNLAIALSEFNSSSVGCMK